MCKLKTLGDRRRLCWYVQFVAHMSYAGARLVTETHTHTNRLQLPCAPSVDKTATYPPPMEVLGGKATALCLQYCIAGNFRELMKYKILRRNHCWIHHWPDICTDTPTIDDCAVWCSRVCTYMIKPTRDTPLFRGENFRKWSKIHEICESFLPRKFPAIH